MSESASNAGALPRPLRLYLAVVALSGPILALGVAAAGQADVTWTRAAFAALLAVLAATADRFRFTLTHRTHVDVTTAVWIAAIVALPTPGPGLLALLAVLAGEMLRHRVRELDLPEFLFNVGQTALAVATAALVYAAVRRAVDDGPNWSETFGIVLAVAAAGISLHLINTGLVTIAAGLHQGVNPVRLWVQGIGQDLAAHAVLVAIGAIAFFVSRGNPLVLIAFAVPIVFVERALRREVRLRQDTHAALAALVEVVELRDPSTAGHSRRMATSARALALRLGLTAEEADLIEIAGQVHDIGKIAIDPAVLNKPGTLSDAEMAEMRRHPGLGADVIAKFAAYHGGNRIVRHHHERWDGSGYPDSLRGEVIPLGARILAVADTFDALTSDRPYRPGMSMPQALQILKEGAGHQWDPAIVAAMVELVEEGVISREPHPAESLPAVPGLAL